MTVGELTLLTSPDCHMCAQARVTLDELGVAWRELADDSAEGEALARVAPPMRPEPLSRTAVCPGDDFGAISSAAGFMRSTRCIHGTFTAERESRREGEDG